MNHKSPCLEENGDSFSFERDAGAGGGPGVTCKRREMTRSLLAVAPVNNNNKKKGNVENTRAVNRCSHCSLAISFHRVLICHYRGLTLTPCWMPKWKVIISCFFYWESPSIENTAICFWHDWLIRTRHFFSLPCFFAILFTLAPFFKGNTLAVPQSTVIYGRVSCAERWNFGA